MFRLTRNHHQANYNYSTKYILACVYIMGSHTAYSDIVKIMENGQNIWIVSLLLFNIEY
jgi:hypothetical protein